MRIFELADVMLLLRSEVKHGALEHEGARFDQGKARRTAIAYLAQTRPRDAA